MKFFDRVLRSKKQFSCNHLLTGEDNFTTLTVTAALSEMLGIIPLDHMLITLTYTGTLSAILGNLHASTDALSAILGFDLCLTFLLFIFRRPGGTHRCRCHRSLFTCSSPAGARRGCCRRSLCTCSSAGGAHRCCCLRSLCTCSSAAGARRGCCRRSLCMCSCAAGARRGCCHRRQGSCRASWLQKDAAPELWPGPMHCLGLHHALRACGAFFVALQRAPPAFSSCLPPQPPGHPCGPTSYSAAYPPCEGSLCSHCGASTPASCPCLFVLFRSAVTLLLKGDYTTERGASLRGREATKLSNTEKTSAHNASFAHLLTLITCQAYTALPSLVLVLSVPSFVNLAGLKSTASVKLAERRRSANSGPTGCLSISMFLTPLAEVTPVAGSIYLFIYFF